MTIARRHVLLAGTAALTVSATASVHAQPRYPSERLNVTIAFGPGGGNDILSRTIVKILEKYKLYPGEIAVTNRAGGSGAVGWGYFYNQRGNPYHLSTTSGSFITTPLQASLPWKVDSFVPVALLATDDLVLLVNGKSEIRDLAGFIAAARRAPMSIGGIGTINVDFIVPKLLSEKAGFKFDYVAFNRQGDMVTALLSNALGAMMSNPAEVLGLIASGDLRALAYSGRKAPESLKGVPTLGEAGYEIGISMPRGLILPPGVSRETQQWWIDTMKKVVETPEWREYIVSNNLTENIIYGDAFTDFLRSTQDGFAAVLRQSGAIK